MNQHHWLSLLESRMVVDQGHLQMEPSWFFSFSFPCKSPDPQWLEEWMTYPLFSHWPTCSNLSVSLVPLTHVPGFRSCVCTGLSCWRPSSGRGQDAWRTGSQIILPMAGGRGNSCRRAYKATPPTPPCSPLSLLLYSQREIFSADFWSPFIYLFLSWQSWEQDLLL